LPALLAALPCQGLVVGSRYVEGGGVENWPKRRQLISRGGSWYARNILAMNIRDLTGGFNAWHHQALRAIDLAAIRSNGYSFQVEMKHQAHDLGLPIAEVPIVFRERRDGQSKMSKRIFIEAMWRVWLMAARSRRWAPFKKVFKFACVGLVGFAIDMGSLVFMVEIFKWNLYLANSISFSLAVVNNFLLNKNWVFRNDSRQYFNQFLNFLAVSLIGLALNYILMKLFMSWQWWYVYAKLLVVLLVAVWNYSANNLWTFRAKRSGC
jgi:putative flippase GtrA